MPTVWLVNPRKRKRHKKARARMNPARRRRRHSSSSSNAPRRRRRFRRNPIAFGGVTHRRRRRHFRRNPIGLVGDLQSLVVPVLAGAGGAIASDLALGYLPIPDTFKSGMLRPVTRAAAGVAIGVIAGMLTSKATGRKVMAGALAVVAYDTAKGWLQQAVPSLPLSGTDEFPIREFATSPMGELVRLPAEGGMSGMGDDSVYGMGEVFDEHTGMAY